MKDTLGDLLTPTLKKIHDTMWEYEVNMPNTPPRYHDDAMVYATKIYAHVLMDRMFAMQETENMPLKEMEKMATYAGEQIRKFVQEMTNIDVSKPCEND